MPKGSCKQLSGNTCFLPTLLKDYSSSCYEYRAVPRKLHHFAAAQPRHLAHGCAQGTSFSNATPGDGLRVQRGSTDGAGPGVSSGKQQPPCRENCYGRAIISSECQQLPKKPQNPNSQGVLNASLLTFPAATMPGNCACSRVSAECSLYSSSSGLQGRSQGVASWRAESFLCSRACFHQDMVQIHVGPLQRMLSIQARVSGP